MVPRKILNIAQQKQMTQYEYKEWKETYLATMLSDHLKIHFDKQLSGNEVLETLL